jgi:uncharacterized membrane protein YfhO
VIDVKGPGRLVISQAHYPGWQFEVDHQKQDIALVEGIFPSIMVDSDEHSVRYYFRPVSFWVGAIFTLLTALGMVLFRWLFFKGRQADS